MRGLFFFWLIFSTIITIIVFLIIRIEEGVTFKDMIRKDLVEYLVTVLAIFGYSALGIGFLYLLVYPLLTMGQ